MKTIRLLCLLWLILPCTGIATIRLVPEQYPTIQGALNAAQPGDTILVNPGTYPEKINFDGKTVILGSLFLTTKDTSYIGQTILSASEQGSVVTFNNGEPPEARLVGFTITDGTGTKEGCTSGNHRHRSILVP